MDERYVKLMEEGINNKKALLQFIDYKYNIVDVGGSTGALTFELADEANKHGRNVYTLEPDKSTFKNLEENIETFLNVEVMPIDFKEFLKCDIYNDYNSPMNFILSSVVHHMYKYREEAKADLKEIFKGLKKYSRVIIRDGVGTNKKEKIGLKCTPSSLKLAKQFLRDFGAWHKGMEQAYFIEGRTVWAEYWLMVEMMLTITWGEKSMERECQEHYTILSLDDYKDILHESSFNIEYAESFTQPGYQMFLPNLGSLVNSKGYEISLPHTNQIIVGIKK